MVVTGFLGSGKTTLLQNILAHRDMKNASVIVNEYGKVSIDHHLLQHVAEKISVLGGGCVCCQVRSDLVDTLRNLLLKAQRGMAVDRIVIETTGLADPAPIAFTILTDPVLQHHMYVSSIVTAVDVVNAQMQINSHPESLKQILVADRIVLTKTDLASAQEVDQLVRELQRLNPVADIMPASFGHAPVERLLSDGWGQMLLRGSQTVESDSHGVHPSQTESVSIRFDTPLHWTGFCVWLSMLLHARGQSVLRVKGIINVGGKGPIALHGVQHIIHPPDHFRDWPSDDHTSRLVFILRNARGDDILSSLTAFQAFLGAKPAFVEVDRVLLAVNPAPTV